MRDCFGKVRQTSGEKGARNWHVYEARHTQTGCDLKARDISPTRGAYLLPLIVPKSCPSRPLGRYYRTSYFILQGDFRRGLKVFREGGCISSMKAQHSQTDRWIAS